MTAVHLQFEKKSCNARRQADRGPTPRNSHLQFENMGRFPLHYIFPGNLTNTPDITCKKNISFKNETS